jgi:uncharacterized membrane protein YkvA (DUF1232 family)
MWQLVLDPNAARGSKLLCLAALFYVISPLDAIPDVIPGIGFLDDIAVVTGAVTFLGYELSKYEEHEGGEVEEGDAAAACVAKNEGDAGTSGIVGADAGQNGDGEYGPTEASEKVRVEEPSGPACTGSSVTVSERSLEDADADVENVEAAQRDYLNSLTLQELEMIVAALQLTVGTPYNGVKSETEQLEFANARTKQSCVDAIIRSQAGREGGTGPAEGSGGLVGAVAGVTNLVGGVASGVANNVLTGLVASIDGVVASDQFQQGVQVAGTVAQQGVQAASQGAQVASKGMSSLLETLNTALGGVGSSSACNTNHTQQVSPAPAPAPAPVCAPRPAEDAQYHEF